MLDCDRVDESNLQRQVLYEADDVGAPKAERARDRLLALNPEIQLIAHQIELCAANVFQIFSDYELIVDGSDRVSTRYLVNDACVIYRKSLVTAAIYRFEGQAMSYAPERGACYRLASSHRRTRGWCRTASRRGCRGAAGRFRGASGDRGHKVAARDL